MAQAGRGLPTPVPPLLTLPGRALYQVAAAENWADKGPAAPSNKDSEIQARSSVCRVEHSCRCEWWERAGLPERGWRSGPGGGLRICPMKWAHLWKSWERHYSRTNDGRLTHNISTCVSANHLCHVIESIFTPFSFVYVSMLFIAFYLNESSLLWTNVLSNPSNCHN